MNHVLRLAIAAVVASTLAACTRDTQLFLEGAHAVSTAEVSGTAIVVATRAFGGAELLAASYLNLRRCTQGTRPLCREASATPVIKGAVYSGRIARDELKAQLRAVCAAEYAVGAECTKGIPVASYNTLVRATKTLEDAMAAYRAATNQ